MTLVQSSSRTVTIAGFPLSAWAFALRIWAAMMVGVYAASTLDDILLFPDVTCPTRTA